MFVGLLGFAFIVVATYFIVKTARETGLSALFWGTSSFIVGLVIQYVLPIFLTIIFFVVYLVVGKRVDDFENSLGGLTIDIACIVASIFVLMLILKNVSKLSDEPQTTDQKPPPPPTFDQEL